MAGSAKPDGAAKVILVAWLITSVYYFYQYVMRSAPAVMMPQLSDAFGMTAVGLTSLLGLFYYGYAPFSLVAGVAMGQPGARRAVPPGAAVVGIGGPMFATGDPTLASLGRFLPGGGRRLRPDRRRLPGHHQPAAVARRDPDRRHP